MLGVKRTTMAKSFIILGFLFVFSLDSFCQGEKWDVYMANYEKGAGSTVLDMAFKAKAPLKEYPFLLITGVKVNDCGPDGLPTKKAFDELYKISDKIKSIMDGSFPNKLVGTFTYQCERVDYYYLTDTTKVREQLDLAYDNNFPKSDKIIKLQKDSKWDAYISFLYPNDETLEYMSNQKVIFNLTDAGDKLTKPRKVDHWLYFKTSTDRDKFAAFIVQKKYKIESKNISEKSNLKYQLQISRIDLVDLESITKITLELRKKALEFNGDYDGWETYIVK